MTTKTKARPILFSAPMIRALLAGTKTQTRRAIKRALKHPGWTQYVYFGPSANNPACESRAIECGPDYPDADDDVVPCPYGAAGDLLWVRETWAWPGEEHLIYRADPQAEELVERWRKDPNFPQMKWRPSIFMPRQHSRLTLRITQVRVQLLQQISQQDCIAEGMPPNTGAFLHHVVADYRRLWGEINGKHSWDSNPWVWAISFEVIHNNVTEIQTNE